MTKQRTQPAHLSATLQHSWALATGAQTLWRGFRQDAQGLPRQLWRRWLRTLVAGFLLVALLTATVTLTARWAGPRGLQAWDEQTLPLILAQAPISFARSITWESPGNTLGMLMIVVTSTLIALLARRPLIAATIAAAYPATVGVLFLGWQLWDRARPQVVANGLAAPELHSFPSGHILLVVMIYGFLTYLWLRASGSWLERALAVVLYLAWISLISLARLVLGAHWPSDILAGIFLGGATLAVVITAVRRAEAARPTSPATPRRQR
jgi:undecaprenyl-diphosphatase